MLNTLANVDSNMRPEECDAISSRFSDAKASSSARSSSAGLKTAIKRHRSELLLIAYIATILLSPLGDSNPDLSELLAASTLILLLAGATYMVKRRIGTTILLPIALLWIVSRTLGAFGHRHPAYAHVSPVAGLLISVIMLASILRRLASPPRVTTGVIAEAFIGYLALASAFSEVFRMLNHFFGVPFNYPVPESQGSTMLYFSMITLTSVGYGGIVPINPYLRMVAALESMLGIFYIAVIVARLASYYRGNERTKG